MPDAVLARRYIGEDSDEADALVELEVSDGEVDLIVSPRTADALTFSLKPEQAWRLARELARAATDAERFNA